jgi:hypothetical protein
MTLGTGSLLELMISLLLVGMNQVDIGYCGHCTPLAVALVNAGLFPSSPIRPSFGFDLNLLDHISILFQYTTPNVEAWCSHFADMLECRGYCFNQVCCLPTHFKLIAEVFSCFRDVSAGL